MAMVVAWQNLSSVSGDFRPYGDSYVRMFRRNVFVMGKLLSTAQRSLPTQKAKRPDYQKSEINILTNIRLSHLLLIILHEFHWNSPKKL